MSDAIVITSPAELQRLVREAVRLEIKPADDSLLTLREAAGHLRCSTKTIVRKVASGEIVPASKHPLRILRSELERGR